MKQEQTMEERFGFTMYDLRGEWANELVKKELLYQLNTKLVVKIALAVQQERERVIKYINHYPLTTGLTDIENTVRSLKLLKCYLIKNIKDNEHNDEYIIKAINQDL